MQTCPACGRNMAQSQRFCTECGQRLETNIAPSAVDGTILDDEPAAATSQSAPSSCSDSPTVPKSASRSISQYDIEQEIGRGGMAIVYKARDPRLNRPIAIKRLRSEFSRSRKAVDRLQVEARTIANIGHPGIVHIFDLGEDAEGPYLVTEYVEGPNGIPCTLEERVKLDGPMVPEEAVDLLVQLCSAVAAANEKGVIHRDIKPSNVLLTQKGAPKLLDFGIAHASEETIGENLSGMTLEGGQLGTPDYMAPEQDGHAGNADERTDVYGLGGVLFFCLTGRSARHFREHEVPQHLRAALSRALETEQANRWCSAKEFALEIVASRTAFDDIKNRVFGMAETHWTRVTDMLKAGSDSSLNEENAPEAYSEENHQNGTIGAEEPDAPLSWNAKPVLWAAVFGALLVIGFTGFVHSLIPAAWLAFCAVLLRAFILPAHPWPDALGELETWGEKRLVSNPPDWAFTFLFVSLALLFLLIFPRFTTSLMALVVLLVALDRLHILMVAAEFLAPRFESLATRLDSGFGAVSGKRLWLLVPGCVTFCILLMAVWQTWTRMAHNGTAELVGEFWRDMLLPLNPYAYAVWLLPFTTMLYDALKHMGDDAPCKTYGSGSSTGTKGSEGNLQHPPQWAVLRASRYLNRSLFLATVMTTLLMFRRFNWQFFLADRIVEGTVAGVLLAALLSGHLAKLGKKGNVRHKSEMKDQNAPMLMLAFGFSVLWVLVERETRLFDLPMFSSATVTVLPPTLLWLGVAWQLVYRYRSEPVRARKWVLFAGAWGVLLLVLLGMPLTRSGLPKIFIIIVLLFLVHAACIGRMVTWQRTWCRFRNRLDEVEAERTGVSQPDAAPKDDSNHHHIE